MNNQEVIKCIEKVCHSLGKPDFNGENHIVNVDGMHWKELSEKFEVEIENLTKHNKNLNQSAQKLLKVLINKKVISEGESRRIWNDYVNLRINQY